MYFEKQTAAAAAELGADVRRTLRAVYRDAAHPPPAAFLTSAEDFLHAYDSMPLLDDRAPFLSKKEEDYLVRAYERAGFASCASFPFICAGLTARSAAVLHARRTRRLLPAVAR